MLKVFNKLHVKVSMIGNHDFVTSLSVIVYRILAQKF